MGRGSKGLVGGASRKSTLTKMVLATARTSGNRVENIALSLDQLRANLINREAVEAFEATATDTRLSRWIERTRTRPVTHASERQESSSIFATGPLFKTSRK